MLQLLVAPTPFEGWSERAYDGTSQRQLLAVLIVSISVLVLTLCVALLMLFADERLGPPDQSRFPIPACLISFAAWGATLMQYGRRVRIPLFTAILPEK